MTSKTRFIFLGTGGNFTFHVLQKLAEEGYRPVAYIQSGHMPVISQTTFSGIELDIVKPESHFFKLLDHHKIPIIYQSQQDLSRFIIDSKIEYLLVACWPSLISDNIIKSVSKAALNLHPSLLPKFRGIDPIGNQLKSKDYNFGISLHLISDTYDAGDIVLQQSLKCDNYQNKINIETVTAIKGAELFIEAINTFKNPGWNLIHQ